MKKNVPYIIGLSALLVLVILVLTTPLDSRKFEERITLRQKDKIPYGTYVAYQLLPSLFPNALIKTEKSPPFKWITDSSKGAGQAVFITAQIFEPDEAELLQINRFIERGNYAFIIANSLSYEAAQHFGTSGSGTVFYMQPTDSLTLAFLSPPYRQNERYIYPGKKWDSYISEFDKKKVRALGTDATGNPNFIQLQKGRGKLFVHLAPLAFSNYFLLHKSNFEYFQKAVSLIPATVNMVTWNEYFLIRRKRSEAEPNILGVLWQHKPFKWALITALATLMIYTLIESRRRRRYIPLYAKPANDSLDFVRTLGRLYYDRKDHQNLARKMSSVFLEGIRSRYHLQTQQLDADFIAELHRKTAYDAAALQSLVTIINHVHLNEPVTEDQLAHFHLQLESFYQNT